MNMCSLFEATRNEGRIEGKIEGRVIEIIETGIEFGLSEESILSRLQKKIEYFFARSKGVLKNV